ncbi:MAG: PAS domain S-box protein, partial [Pseudomonadales bacterium]
MAGAIGLLTLVEYVFGIQLRIDQLFFEHYITVQTSHPGRMAPSTALCFSLTAAALLAAARWKQPGQRSWIVGLLALVVLSLGATAFFGYVVEAKTAYGWGQLSRMSVHTSAGFVALAVGILAIAFREGVVWAATTSAFLPDQLVRERRKIVAASVGIMALFSMAVGLTVIRELYSTGLDVQRDRLAELVRTQTRMIEAEARFDEQYSRDVPGGARAHTLNQVVEAHERSPGFGQTGEFTLARREDDEIVFIVRPPRAGPDFVERVAIDLARAEPMKRALDGESGTLIGVDYRGERVVAAYAPVAPLDLGIVAKMDLAEVRAPFVRSAFLTTAIALTIIAIGAGATMVSIDPLARRVETQTMDLISANVELKREAAQHEESLRALRESEARFRGFFEHAPELCYMVSPDGITLDANETALKTLGREREELVGKPLVTSIYAVSSREKAKSLFAKWLETGVLRDEELTIVTKDGSERDVLLSVEAVRDSAGRLLHSISVQRDITERKRAEEVLLKSEKRFRTLASNIPGVSYRCSGDKHRTMEFISDAVEPLTGYPASDFIQRRVRPYASIIHPDDVKFMENAVRDTVDRREPFTVEYRIVRVDGEMRWVYEKGQSVFDDRGEVLWVDGVIVDITERKQAEDALRKSRQRLRNLAARLHAVREEERTMIAREMHDELGQSLTGL